MILRDIRLPVGYSGEELHAAVRKAAKKPGLKIRNVQILKRSVDARKKPKLSFVLTLAVNETVLPAFRPEKLALPKGERRPVVVAGAGPAGLFASLVLSEAGEKVILVERGEPVEARVQTVERFFAGGALDPESNVQFGEGGAGTFSDGKLNTLIRDEHGYGAWVLRTFYEAGAPEDILFDAKPHIGTDVLRTVIRNLREKLLSLGAEIRCRTKLKDLFIEEGKFTGILLEGPEGEERIPLSALVLAIGHSARDTYEMLLSRGVEMTKKAFAVGLRIEHPQEMITLSQYGTLDYEELGAAPYKLTAKAGNGRGVYSFCMCPGGYVVNASSEPGRLAVNGMSDHARDSKNSNAALVVQVTPEDYPGDGPLSGVDFQRELERRAFEAGDGRIPVQTLGDFLEGEPTEALGEVVPMTRGAWRLSELNQILPPAVAEALKDAIPEFGRKIRGFDRPDAVLSAVESRTSSPVRITRDPSGQSVSLPGLFPAGEGAGYAGGIMSAAIDGITEALRVLAYLKGERDE